MHLKWYKNNANLPNCDDFQYMDYNNGEFGLKFNDVFLADSGSYKCEVYNCYGDATSTCHLIVEGNIPRDIKLHQCDEISYCIVYISEEIDIIDQSTFSTNSIACNGHFSAARVVEGPVDVNALRGDTISLKVAYAGDPEPAVKWMKAVSVILESFFFYKNINFSTFVQPQGRQLSPDKRILINTENGSSVLKIENVTADDGGKYEICVENVQGNDTHTTSLAVEGTSRCNHHMKYIFLLNQCFQDPLTHRTANLTQ